MRLQNQELIAQNQQLELTNEVAMPSYDLLLTPHYLVLSMMRCDTVYQVATTYSGAAPRREAPGGRHQGGG